MNRKTLPENRYNLLLEILRKKNQLAKAGIEQYQPIDHSTLTIAQVLRAIYLDVVMGKRDEYSGLNLASVTEEIETNPLANDCFHLWQHLSIHHTILNSRQQEVINWKPVSIPIHLVVGQTGLTEVTLTELYRGEGSASNLNRLLKWYSFQLPSTPRNSLYAVVAVLSSIFLTTHVHELIKTDLVKLSQQRDELYNKLTH